ncbi:unnamed protein product [Clonostachys rosea f. rosea IK726]|uniref:Uncharacterized protein n=1 Tax=Clonostachys rosea f. rosea IK726 TaxID=1349383 RepID=A0ACA9UCB2_BIOOC|nr:unnamed protein product [Clonostachys rosea f. rosea IK726]
MSWRRFFQHDSSPLSAFDLYLDPHVSLGRRRQLLLALVRTPAQLIGLRFLLGVFEAGFTLPARSALSDFDMVTAIPHIISAAVFSGAFGSLISAGITSGLDGVHGIAGWRWLFIVEGVTTWRGSFDLPFILLDYPQTTKKFTQEERDIAYYRLLEDGVFQSYQ